MLNIFNNKYRNVNPSASVAAMQTPLQLWGLTNKIIKTIICGKNQYKAGIRVWIMYFFDVNFSIIGTLHKESDVMRSDKSKE